MKKPFIYTCFQAAALLIPLLVTDIAYKPAYAQEVNGKKVQKFAPDYWSKSKRHENLYDMKEAPDLPGLPAYAGETKFLHGLMEPGANNRVNYQMTFLAKDDPKRVMDWYLNIVQSNNWNIMTSSSNVIVATNSTRSMCTINALPMTQEIKGQKYKTKLRVMYRLMPGQAK